MGAVKSLVLSAQEGTLDRINGDGFTGLPCAHCDGEGYVEYLVYGRGAGPEGLEPIYEQAECPHCVWGWQPDDAPAGDFPPRLPIEAYATEGLNRIDCRRCQGIGEVWAGDGDHPDDGPWPCPDCDGQGYGYAESGDPYQNLIPAKYVEGANVHAS